MLLGGCCYNGQTEGLLEVSCSSGLSGTICYTWCNQVSYQMKTSGLRRYRMHFVQAKDLIQLAVRGNSQTQVLADTSGGPSW